VDEIVYVRRRRNKLIFAVGPIECRRAVKPSFPYPGIPATADGSEAVVWVETHITQGACAYPITPSTNMGGGYQLAVANGQRNLWGEHLGFLELESEQSAAHAACGFG